MLTNQNKTAYTVGSFESTGIITSSKKTLVKF